MAEELVELMGWSQNQTNLRKAETALGMTDNMDDAMELLIQGLDDLKISKGVTMGPAHAVSRIGEIFGEEKR